MPTLQEQHAKRERARIRQQKRESKIRDKLAAYLAKLPAAVGLMVDDFYRWKILTPAGTLRVDSHSCAVFTRFDEPDRAATFQLGSGRTGKWNFHESMSDQGVVEQFADNLDYFFGIRVT